MQTRLVPRIPRVVELVSHSRGIPSQIPLAQSLHVFDCDLPVVVHVQGLEERVNVLLLGVEVRIEHPVGVGQDRHRLSHPNSTFTGSICPVLSLS